MDYIFIQWSYKCNGGGDSFKLFIAWNPILSMKNQENQIKQYQKQNTTSIGWQLPKFKNSKSSFE